MEDLVSRRLRLLPLQAAVALGDWLGQALRKRNSAPPSFPQTSSPGISVVIPERANPHLLGLCLESVVAAGRELSEPFEIVVVVNGSNPADYTPLTNRFADVRWLHIPQPLGFADSVRRGLRVARFDWIYLANNDTVLDRFALLEVVRWRAPHVFAIGSQILPGQEGESRVETGWTDLAIQDGLVKIFDAEPDGNETRGSLYAGGGSSLFQRTLLARFLGSREPYYPFYWEDVEWGARARMDGFQILFCPASKVWHQRRATISKFHNTEEIERIFERNAFQFQLRNLSRLGSIEKLYAKLLEANPATLTEITGWRKVISVFMARVELARTRFDDSVLTGARRSYHIAPPGQYHSKPVVVVVSPYAVYPPLHGGAIRIYQLLRRLAADFHIILLSDEAAAYPAAAVSFFRELSEVHLVSGRLELATQIGATGQDRINRIKIHSNEALRQKLAMLLYWYDPALVNVEFIELGLLISARKGRARWLLTLHDVLFGGKNENDEDRYERELSQRYDGLIASSPEDFALLKNSPAWLVPNAVDPMRVAYRPSSGSAILFAGPFRYLPNFEGIRQFLEEIYPRLREEVPDLEIWILGGPGSIDRTQGIPCFRQRGVLIYDGFFEPGPFLERCALTINPLVGIRGSSIKLLESIAAGRVVVSTCDGARGFLEDGFPSLIAVETISDFGGPLLTLLKDSAHRIALERPPVEQLEKYSWNASAKKLAEVYGHYIDELPKN